MGKPTREVSPALLAAQQRLFDLREAQRVGMPAADMSLADNHGRSPRPIEISFTAVNGLPDHLGWDSMSLTAVLRRQHKHKKNDAAATSQTANVPPEAPSPTPKSPTSSAVDQTIKLYPDIALGILRREQAAAGRLWLLLRHLDNEGRGWLRLEAAREQLTRNNSPWRVCGRRQLRNLLAQGEGIFWERSDGRLWLRSVAKTAAALDVRRLTLNPITLPVSALLQGIGQVRAHFYASFHSGRDKQDGAAPIARATLTRISHVHQRTQRIYERKTDTRARRNFAVGPQASQTAGQQMAWRHGGAVFQFADPVGRHGRKGDAYLAWQLPNHYVGPHAIRPRGRMKRINQELADLFNQGMTGNGESKVEGDYLPRRFYGNGRLAAQAYNRAGARDIYWKHTTGNGRYQLWYVLHKERRL